MAKVEKLVRELKLERKNLRRALTVAVDGYFKCQLSEDKETACDKVLDKSDRLFKVDSELRSLIEATEAEFDLAETYRDKVIDVRQDFKKHVQEPSGSTMVDNIKLPKININEVDLNPRTWVAFWGQFSRIHVNSSLKEEDKFVYLLASLRPNTKARDIAESYPPSKENYAKCIEHIRSRFGRDDLLIEVYFRDLLALVSNKQRLKLGLLFDRLGSYLRALETLGVTTKNYAAMLYPVVESCLPADVLKAWDRHRLSREMSYHANEREKMLGELMVFLGSEVEGEEHRALADSTSMLCESGGSIDRDLLFEEPSAVTLLSGSGLQREDRILCLFCGKRDHNSQDCSEAAGMSLSERKSIIMRKRCCLVCLRVGHIAKGCNTSVRCVICKRRHYALICPDVPVGDVRGARDISSLSAVGVRVDTVYLKTILVNLLHNGRKRKIRALLDDGSHRSYIEKSLAGDLGLVPSGREILSQSLFGGGQTEEAEHGRYRVTLQNLRGGFSCEVSVLDQSIICTNLPRVRDRGLLAELDGRGITLTDVGPEEPPIQMLLGADTLGRVLTGRIEVLRSGVSAIETGFGWSVLGTQNKKYATSMVYLSLQRNEVPKLWELETIGIKDPIEEKSGSIIDEELLRNFRENIRLDSDQRYEVSLPWLAGHPPLDSHFDIAESRLQSVTKRLKRDGIFKLYNDVFNQWESEGIIEAIPQDDPEPQTMLHYLPHRPVLKPSSSTTKIHARFPT